MSARRCGVVGGVDVARPHDDGVLAGLGVVVAPHPDGREAEAPVQRLGGGVRHPHLEGEVAHPERGGGARLVEEQHRADAAAVPGRVDGQGGDVPVLLHHHEPAVADHEGADGGHGVAPRPPLGQLGQEDRRRPRPRVVGLFDRGPPMRRCRRRSGAMRTAPATRSGPSPSGAVVDVLGRRALASPPAPSALARRRAARRVSQLMRVSASRRYAGARARRRPAPAPAAARASASVARTSGAGKVEGRAGERRRRARRRRARPVATGPVAGQDEGLAQGRRARRPARSGSGAPSGCSHDERPRRCARRRATNTSPRRASTTGTTSAPGGHARRRPRRGPGPRGCATPTRGVPARRPGPWPCPPRPAAGEEPGADVDGRPRRASARADPGAAAHELDGGGDGLGVAPAPRHRRAVASTPASSARATPASSVADSTARTITASPTATEQAPGRRGAGPSTAPMTATVEHDRASVVVIAGSEASP